MHICSMHVPGKYIEVLGEKIYLHPDKAIYLPDYKLLVVADLHLGKATHFRKAGLPISTSVGRSDLSRLQKLIHDYNPREVLFLGDVFHSDYNSEWDLISKFCEENADVQFSLTLGNHDVLPVSIYADLGWKVHAKEVTYGALSLCHEPDKNLPFAIVGHLHPGYHLKGRGKQKILLPCFHLMPHQLLMPSFGFFTGAVPQKMTKKDIVFAIADNEVFEITHAC